MQFSELFPSHLNLLRSELCARSVNIKKENNNNNYWRGLQSDKGNQGPCEGDGGHTLMMKENNRF